MSQEHPDVVRAVFEARRHLLDRERFTRKGARRVGSDALPAILIGAAEAGALPDAISSASAIARTARG